MLGALTSLTGGGGLSAGGGSGRSGDTGAVGINVGGLNVPAMPGQRNLLLLSGVAILGLVLWKKM